jgi:molybdenum cofactor cytidylyltransferase
LPTAHSARVAAIVLAAGKSTRMGEAKQLLRLGDRTVLGQTIENVRSSALHEIVLVLGASAEAIRSQLPASLLQGLNVVVNPAYEQGMASSLQTGLAALDPQTSATLVVLADQPFVRPETLNHLADRYRTTKTQIVIPTYQGVRGNPVLLDRSVFAEAMELQGDVGCRAIFSSHKEQTVTLEVEDEGILLDIDNHEDYQRLREGAPPRTGE